MELLTVGDAAPGMLSPDQSCASERGTSRGHPDSNAHHDWGAVRTPRTGSHTGMGAAAVACVWKTCLEELS